MADRLPTTERRAQIVDATLALLASTPVERITTRQIAEAVGISQPALFRHFDSREALLAAVVERARAALHGAAQAAIEAGRGEGAFAACGRLAQALGEHVVAQPGLPRLLFHELAAGGAPDVAGPLRHLISAQRALVAELLREGQRRGQVPAAVDPDRAGRLFVATVQGLLVQWQLAGRPADLAAAIADGVSLWAAGVEAGQPAGEPAPSAASAPAEALAPLDVRPLIAGGADPLADILAALGRLAPDGVLALTAPFRPAPLLTLLTSKGLRPLAWELRPGVWRVDVLGPDAPEPLDLRDLEPPEPLEQVLLACADAERRGGGTVVARLPRFPRLLMPRLAERGGVARVHEEEDGSALLHLRIGETA